MKFVNVFDIEHRPKLVPSKSNEPSMTSTDLFLSTKQRIQNLLNAGHNLLNYRLGDEYFEQTGSTVNENIVDRPLNDLHDYNQAVRDLADKSAAVNASIKKASVSQKKSSVTSDSQSTDNVKSNDLTQSISPSQD